MNVRSSPRQAGRAVLLAQVPLILAYTVALAEPIAGGAAEPAWSWMRAVFGVLLCIGLVVLGGLALRFRAAGAMSLGGTPLAHWVSRLRRPVEARPHPQIELLQRLVLTPNAHLCLIRFNREHYLLAIAGGAVTLVSRSG